jgi:hypothetical protein
MLASWRRRNKDQVIATGLGSNEELHAWLACESRVRSVLEKGIIARG